MADDIVIAADQLLAREARKFDKGVVGVGRDALEVGPRYEVGALRERFRILRDRKVDFHLFRPDDSLC